MVFVESLHIHLRKVVLCMQPIDFQNAWDELCREQWHLAGAISVIGEEPLHWFDEVVVSHYEAPTPRYCLLGLFHHDLGLVLYHGPFLYLLGLFLEGPAFVVSESFQTLFKIDSIFKEEMPVDR
jgi:hypothetical protein